MNFFQSPVSRLGKKQKGKYNEESVGAEPDVAVLGTPSKFCRVDEIRSSECSQPVADEIQSCGEAVREWSKLVIGKFTPN